MKKFALIVMCMAALHMHAQTYNLDVKSSRCTWRGYAEIGKFYQEGEIGLKASQIELRDQLLVHGQLTFDMQSIKTQDPKLLGHLNGPDFFHSEKFEEAIFRINESPLSSVNGDLTIRDKTHPQDFVGSWLSSDSSIHVSGSARFDRTLYDIKYNSNRFFQDLGSYAIKDTVTLQCDLQFYLEK